MREGASGSGRARLQREGPREIEPSSAALEPPRSNFSTVFVENSTATGQSETRSAVDGTPPERRRRQGENARKPSEDMPRLVVSDRQWRRVRGFLTVKRGRKAKNLRKQLEAWLWIFRTGAPWRDLPRFFGRWNSVYQAFRRMCTRGVFLQMFMSLVKQGDLTIVMVDGSFVKVHQHAVGARRGERTPEESRVAQAIGKTKGGLNTNLLALTDKNGKLVAFSLIPGNWYEAHSLARLLEGLPVSEIEELLADKAYDTNAVREMLAEMGIDATIPSKSNRKEPIPHDHYSYKGRHLIENLFVDLKEFRGIASRYHKLAAMFCAGIHLVTWHLRTRGRKERRSEYLSGR